MLEDRDIERIIKANQEMFSSKKDLEDFRNEMREKFSALHTSIDEYSRFIFSRDGNVISQS